MFNLYSPGIKKPFPEKKSLEKALVQFKPIFQKFLLKYNVKTFEIDVNFCGKTKMKALNTKYRQKNKPTDVLSFPAFEDLRQNKSRLHSPLHLGDIVICLDVARSQAKTFKLTPLEEIMHLLIHGALHLVGFDHEVSAKEEKLMEKMEEQLLIAWGKKLK